MEAFRSNNQSAETVDTTTSNKLCDSNCQNIVIPIPTVTSSPTNNQQTKGLTTMTPQEIADWIDRRSRILFPASFFIFNAFYWGFVWI